jgi:hypothetical protein
MRATCEPKCEVVRDLVPELLGGQLDAVETARLRAHIDGCADCAAEYALASTIAARRYVHGAGFEERVLAATLNRRGGFWTAGRAALAAAIAAVAIGGGVLLGSPNEPEPVAVEASAPTPDNSGLIRVEDAVPTGASLNDLSIEELERLLAEMGS